MPWGEKKVMDTFLHVEVSPIIKSDFDGKWSSAQFKGNGRI